MGSREERPFDELNSAILHVFDAYQALTESFSKLSKDVFKIPMDTKEKATLLNIMGKESRDTFKIYLGCVQKMCKVITDFNGGDPTSAFESCKFHADIALRAMKELHEQRGPEEMLNSLETVAAALEDKKTNKNEDMAVLDGETQKVEKEKGNPAKGLILVLFGYIKEELKKATDDSGLYISSAELKSRVQEVKKSVSAAKEAYGENVTTMGKVKDSFDTLSHGTAQNDVINGFKANAKTLKEFCEKELTRVNK